MTADYVVPRANYTIREAERVIESHSEVRKITGTSVGALLGVNPYQTPFVASAKLLGLGDEIGISDKPAVKAGVALEGRIIDYIRDRYAKNGELGVFDTILSAEEVYAPREGDHESWKTDWEDPVFGGHVDCICYVDGQPYIGEVKTAKNLIAWADGVPEHYLWQVYLYNHFITHQKKAYVMLGVVTDETYADPSTWKPTDENCQLYEVDIPDNVEEVIGSLRQWYMDHTKKGLTAQWTDNVKDRELLDWLRALSAKEENIKAILDEFVELSTDIEQYDIQIMEKRKRAERLKDILKAWMDTHAITELATSDMGFTAKLSYSQSKKWDETAMRTDGIDVDKYLTTNTVKRFTYGTTKNKE